MKYKNTKYVEMFPWILNWTIITVKIWAIADSDQLKIILFLWVFLLLKWVGQLFSNIAGVRTRLTYINNPPHPTTTTLDDAFCVWMHVQHAAHFRYICGNFEPICASATSLFLLNESNENRFNKYTDLWWKTFSHKSLFITDVSGTETE